MTKPKTKRQAKSARKAKLNHHKPTNAIAPNPDCPYRSGTLYATLFTEGDKDFIETRSNRSVSHSKSSVVPYRSDLDIRYQTCYHQVVSS